MSFGDVKRLKIVSDTSHFVETWENAPSATIGGSISNSIDPGNGRTLVASSSLETWDAIWASPVTKFMGVSSFTI